MNEPADGNRTCHEPLALVMGEREGTLAGRQAPRGSPSPGRLSAFGAESQNRTGDTAIFSRVLYQLSYLGPGSILPAA